MVRGDDVITELFLPRGSLISDIPAGDGKLVNLFYGAYIWGEGAWGALILDRCRAFDLFASADAHLCRTEL